MADRESTTAGGGGASWAILAATAAVSALAGVGVATVAARVAGRRTGEQPPPAAAAAAAGGSPALGAPDKAGTPRANEVNQEAIIEEHLARNIAFFGPDSVRRVRQSFVVIVGLGGVGASRHRGLASVWPRRLTGRPTW